MPSESGLTMPTCGTNSAPPRPARPADDAEDGRAQQRRVVAARSAAAARRRAAPPAGGRSATAPATAPARRQAASTSAVTWYRRTWTSAIAQRRAEHRREVGQPVGAAGVRLLADEQGGRDERQRLGDDREVDAADPAATQQIAQGATQQRRARRSPPAARTPDCRTASRSAGSRVEPAPAHEVRQLAAGRLELQVHAEQRTRRDRRRRSGRGSACPA